MRIIKNWLIKQLYIILFKYDNKQNIQIVLQEMKDCISYEKWTDNNIYTKDKLNIAIDTMRWIKRNKAGKYTNKFRIIKRIENIIKE